MKKIYRTPICETVEYMPLDGLLINISVGPQEQEAGTKSDNVEDDYPLTPWYKK